jgi:TraM recognition site of TraD and TraG
VVTVLVDRLLTTATQIAAARGGRCEPPPRVVLDEAANICPIKDLPDLYSYFGSMSIQAITILQSYQQGVAVWGQAGMHKLWSARACMTRSSASRCPGSSGSTTSRTTLCRAAAPGQAQSAAASAGN